MISMIKNPHESPDAKDPKRRTLLYFSSIAHAYTHIVILAIVPLLPLIQSAEGGFDLSWRDSFLFASISVFFFGFGAIPTGFFADRIGPLKVISIGLFVVITSIVLIIIAPNIIIFGLALVMLGFGSSFYHPAGLSLVSQVFKNNRGLPLGIHGALGNIGELSTPILSGIIGALYGWRSAYLLWFGIGIVILIWNMILIIGGVEGAFIKGYREKLTLRSTGKKVLKAISIAVVLVMLYALLFELAYRGTIQFIPFAARSFHGLDPEGAATIGGILVTVLIGVGTLSQIAGGLAADRYGNRLPLLMLSTLAIIALLIMMSQAFSVDVTMFGRTFPMGTMLVGAALFGFALFGTQPIINKLYAEITPADIRGFFYGLMFFTKVGLASLALVALAFIPEDNIRLGFYLLIGFASGAVIIVLFMRDAGKQIRS